MKVTWLPKDILSGPGVLGLTHAPGADEAHRDEDLADLAALGVDLLVSLQEPHELRRMVPPETIAERRAAVEASGVAFHSAPIEDFCAPNLAQARALTSLIGAALSAGQRVVLHCHAGLGRAGTIAACLLIDEGRVAEESMMLVRWVRPGAIQSEAQERLIARYAEQGPPEARG